MAVRPRQITVPALAMIAVLIRMPSGQDKVHPAGGAAQPAKPVHAVLYLILTALIIKQLLFWVVRAGNKRYNDVSLRPFMLRNLEYSGRPAEPWPNTQWVSAALAVCCVGLLAGCLPAIDRPDPPTFDPAAAFSAEIPDARSAPVTSGSWWRNAVRDDISTSLEQTLRNNAALRQADSEVLAARARVSQAQADRGPQVFLDADLGTQKASGDDWIDSRSLGLSGDLPIDLSGSLAARERVARRALDALRADAEQLESDLARDYLLALFDGTEAQQRARLLARQVEVAQTLQRLIELRFTQGLASSVDVLQQRDETAALRQQIPVAELDRVRAINRLRLLGNQPPSREMALPVDRLPVVQADFPTVEPVGLLERRADLRADQARLEAADAGFAAALADRLPTVGLSGGVLSRALGGDGSTLISVALEAAFAVFDSGLREAVAQERRAQLSGAGEAYLGNWIARVVAADDLIHEEASLRRQIELSRLRLETAEALLDAARRRYERGVSDYLPVLAALRGLQQQERDHLALRAALGRARVRLHHALGNSPPEGQT